jgi:AcrR family transcriptional regulator
MDKKSAILEATRSLIARHGIKKTTTDEIAGAATVSKATLYKYYRNKDEIVNDLFDWEAERLYRAVTEAVSKEDTAKGKLRAHLLTRFNGLREIAAYYRLTLEVWYEYRLYIDSVQNRIADQELSLLKDILAFGNDSGELAVRQTDLIARVMVISLKSLENPWVLDNHHIGLIEYVDLMIETIIYGIAAKRK